MLCASDYAPGTSADNENCLRECNSAIRQITNLRYKLGRNAEFHSAVSRICNPPGCRSCRTVLVDGSLAEYNSAIRQIANLRYKLGSSAEFHSAVSRICN